MSDYVYPRIYDEQGDTAAKNRIEKRKQADMLRREAESLAEQAAQAEGRGDMKEGSRLTQLGAQKIVEADRIDPYRKPPKLKVHG